MEERARPKILKKKSIGIIFIVFGFLSLVTPFTPGSWLIFVGLELVGIRLAFKDKIKLWYQKFKTK